MKQRFTLIFTLLFPLSLIASGASAQPDSFEPTGVRFEGVESVERTELAETIAAQAPPFWKLWAPRVVVSRQDLEDDLLRIRQFYQERGYYHTEAVFRVEPDPEDIPETGAVPARVVFSVVEGPPALIAEIDIASKENADREKTALLAHLPLAVGGIFRIDQYRLAKQEIQRFLGNQGYPFAEVSGQVVVDAVANRATIRFDIAAGNKYGFGPLVIRQTPEFVRETLIRRAMAFTEGETYASEKVEQSQRNLFNLDIFRLALVRPEKPETEAERVPVEVTLEPRKPQNVQIGAGYGNEDGFRISGAWSYRNLLGYGGKIGLSGRRSDLIETVQAEYLQPYFLDSKTTLRSRTGFEREKFESYTNRKLFADAILTRALRKSWLLTGGYNLEVNRLEDFKLTDPVEIESSQEQSEYYISSLIFGITRDTADHPLNPTAGSVASLTAEKASRFLGSEVSYFRPALEVRNYRPILKGVVFAQRVRLETIEKTEGTETIPIFKRLYLGGASTVRGYDFQQLGRLDQAGNPVEGLSLFNANLELRFPIYRKFSGIVFLDMGVLDEESFRFDFSGMRYSTGAGLRYDTIVGPMRVDFGYKLNPPTRGDFGLPGDPNEKIGDRWRIHFSIGQAF